MELQELCTMCSNAIAIKCGTCKCTPYCSAACLQADRPIHRILCGELQKFMTPPSASARRGIFFPVDQKTPQFVWATTQWYPPEDSDPEFEELDLKPYLGDQAFDRIRIFGNYIRSRPRQDQIMVFMRDTCCIDGSKVNSSIIALTKGNAFHSWSGGMLAMKLPSLEIDPGEYVNMDMVDFRDVVDLFGSYLSGIEMSDSSCNQRHKGPASPLDDMLKAMFRQPGKSNSKKSASSGTASSSFGKTGVNYIDNEQDTSSVEDMLNNLNLGEKNKNEALNETRIQTELGLPGVRINCVGDCENGRPYFEAITVSILDPVWSAPIPSMSKLVGLPIRVRKVPSRIEPEAKSKRIRKKPAFSEVNHAATFLHVTANPKAEDWGWAPLRWQGPAGSVVVVHAERKEVLSQHVEALCYLCQYVMQPVFEDSLGAMDSEHPLPKDDVLRRLTPREFQLFYFGFRNWKQDNDPNYELVALPS